MRLGKYLFLLLFALFIFQEKSFSLTDYKIKIICSKERKKLDCIKNLKEKRTDLNEGNLIEIPVVPYKR